MLPKTPEAKQDIKGGAIDTVTTTLGALNVGVGIDFVRQMQNLDPMDFVLYAVGVLILTVATILSGYYRSKSDRN